MAGHLAVTRQLTEIVAADGIRDQVNALDVGGIDHPVPAPGIENPAFAGRHVDFTIAADEAH